MKHKINTGHHKTAWRMSIRSNEENPLTVESCLRINDNSKLSLTG